jgi:hypothetical protein
MSLIASVVIPLSGTLDAEFMEGADDEERESYRVSNSMIRNRQQLKWVQVVA